MGRLSACCCALLLLAAWLYLSPDGSGEPPGGDEGRRAFEDAWWARFRQLSFAQNSTFARLPQRARNAANALLLAKRAGASFPDDVAGFYRGRWQAAHVDERTAFWNGTLPDGYARPADASTGALALQLRARPSAWDAVSLVSGSAQLRGEAGGYAAGVRIQGIYWRANGTGVLYGAPEISAQTTADVVLAAPSEQVFAQAQAIYDESLGGHLLSYTRPEDAARGCSYHLYGRFDVDGRGLRLQAAMFSANCGVLVTTPAGQPAVGIGADAYGPKAARYALAGLAGLAVQAALLVSQMRHTPTPAGLSMVSYRTLSMQVVLDCYAFIVNVIAAMSLDSLYVIYTAAAVLAYTLSMALNMRYLAVVWHTQCPAAAAATADPVGGAGGGGSELWRIYLRFYAALVPGVYIIYTFIDSRTPLSGWLLAVLLAVIYSYWVPQIWRNAAVGSARGVRMSYVCGTTLVRLFFPVYFLACPGNIALVTPTRLAWLLPAFSAAQAAVLVLQRVFGPRFFIPPPLRPADHDYQSALPPADEESAAGPSHGGSGDPGSGPDSGAGCDPSSSRHCHTCAICLVSVASPAAPEAPTAPAATPPAPAHAVTPCRHVYHRDCLVRWMEIKLECPVCRAPLPPVQDP
ncbi:hypothetical protein LPJ61_003435 [Coemansia biformis]|uniref:RING-type E3 ubiquitin transferase n=1 Tax=Coemansia biformis TaxID=1286918 RepID=A0A9W7YDV6_9FUNG|nr:hypothetical protein LPJ61_003435 [Coemansia biformis]